MHLALFILLPYMLLTKKFKLLQKKTLGFALFCGVLFASDVLFGILIQESTATKRSLTNLSPLVVGIISYVFLKVEPLPILIGNSSRLIWHGDASRIPFF
jgi:drug/metabolite transporter (DMT)-like permease